SLHVNEWCAAHEWARWFAGIPGKRLQRALGGAAADAKKLAASAAPTGASAVAIVLDFDFDFDPRGPSVAAEPADKTRRAPHMDVRRFPRGQDAPSENPAGSANPVQCTGRVGGVCFLCARFLCTSKERGLAPSRRESS